MEWWAIFRTTANRFWGLRHFACRVDSGFRVYAGAFYAAQRRHPAAREKTLNPKLDTNHSLGRDPKVRALRVSGRAKARASRVAFEKNLPDLKNAENLARTCSYLRTFGNFLSVS